MNPVKPLFALLAVAAISGCSALPGYDSAFSCPNAELGSPCMSAREAYKASDNDFTAGTGDTKSGEAGKKGGAPTRNARPAPILALPGLDAPKPIRTPSKVMRIYVSPWVSEDGALTMPSYVFTEIEPRRWTIGERALEGADQDFHPLQVGESSKGGDPVNDPNHNRTAPSTRR